MDLGCGEGHAARYFFRRGVAAMAVDGSGANLHSQVFPIYLHDIRSGPVTCDVDLVWCQETVEHIDEAYISNLIESLACGRIIVMTHAFPGQGGYHHVNCQPPEYWIDRITDRGYDFFDVDTNRVRVLASSDGAHHANRSALVFGSRT